MGRVGTYSAHKTRHQTGGVDEVSIASLAGSPAQKAAASGLASLSAGSLVVQKPADRLTKANFEITLNKLLKGAGAGADPTEIDVPAGPTIVRKTADETVNNSIVLQNDDHLFFAVGANEVWEFLLYLRCQQDNAAADYQWGFAIPAASTLNLFPHPYTIGMLPVVNGAAANSLVSAVTTVTDFWARFIYIGGANAGNVQFQWSQFNATVANNKILTNSYIVAHKLA